MTSLFISYCVADRRLAGQVQSWLRIAGLQSTFLDVDPDSGIVAGQRWECELYGALRSCDAVVFISSAASFESRWCFAEIALARASGKHVFPLRVDGGPRLELVRDVQEIELGDSDTVIARLVDGLRRAGLDPSDSFAWDRTRSPYPGLSAFVAEDTAVFFGRAEETSRVLGLLQPTLVRGTGRWVGIVGPSGSGKSSLLLAGVLPRLARQPGHWILIPPFTPGTRPLRSLASTLCRALTARGITADSARIEWEIGDPTTGLDAFEAHIRKLQEAVGGRANVLVSIDQAEELVTRAGPREQATFLGLLTRSLGDDSPLWVVSTMRSEYLSTAPDRASVSEVINDYVVIGPLSRARLSEVIARPAQRSGLEFDAGLVERMVDETTGGDALPLLAYTLQELAERTQPAGMITIDSYESVGGVVGGIRRRADTLSADLRRRGLGELVLPTLLRLAAVDDDGQPARRRVRRSRFSTEELVVVDAFVDARLLVSSAADRVVDADDDGPPSDSELVEVAHEALLRQWPPLYEVIEESRSTLRLRANLERQAADWEQGDRDPSYLLRGVRLAAVDSWLGEDPDDVTGSERRFLDASRAAAQDELDRTHLLQHRDSVARQMQHAMLSHLPAVSGLAMAARYQPADSREDVGGDWYDAFPLPDADRPSNRLLAVSVGEVNGEAIDAATVMGQVRSMLRQAAWDHPGEPPSRVLRAFELAVGGMQLQAMGSALLAHLYCRADRRWAMTWTNAGHPPPILLGPDGEPVLLDGHDIPFGSPGVAAPPRHDHHHDLDPGSTLFLYTDGLVERPGSDLDEGTDRLRRLLAANRELSPRELVHLAVATLGPDSPDDVVAFALHFPP